MSWSKSQHAPDTNACPFLSPPVPSRTLSRRQDHRSGNVPSAGCQVGSPAGVSQGCCEECHRLGGRQRSLQFWRLRVRKAGVRRLGSWGGAAERPICASVSASGVPQLVCTLLLSTSGCTWPPPSVSVPVSLIL